jgi:tRNA(Ile)-lysidine synthase
MKPRAGAFAILERRLLSRVAQLAPIPVPRALGLSGGRDSVVLAEAMRRVGVTFEAWHFNHGWRGEASDADADWVRAWCRERGIPCRTGRARGVVRKTEGEARRVRWAFFDRRARAGAVEELWLAHHADDRAETLLLQLMRGAGPGGLSGPRLRRQRGGWVVLRPLVGFRRAELARLARGWKLTWREDASNEDLAYRRNALRARGLPALSRWSGRDVVPLLARTAEILEDEEDYWAQILPSLWPERLGTRDLARRPVAWQRRVLRAWLTARGILDADFEQIESVRRMLTSPAPARVNLSRGRSCRRRAQHFFIEPSV